MAVAVASTRSVSARSFLRIALASCVALFLVITSGAFVRLTGSGLGCENWPSCGDKPYPEQGFHAFVEFGNRMVALVGIDDDNLDTLSVARPGLDKIAADLLDHLSHRVLLVVGGNHD